MNNPLQGTGRGQKQKCSVEDGCTSPKQRQRERKELIFWFVIHKLKVAELIVQDRATMMCSGNVEVFC